MTKPNRPEKRANCAAVYIFALPAKAVRVRVNDPETKCTRIHLWLAGAFSVFGGCESKYKNLDHIEAFDVDQIRKRMGNTSVLTFYIVACGYIDDVEIKRRIVKRITKALGWERNVRGSISDD